MRTHLITDDFFTKTGLLATYSELSAFVASLFIIVSFVSEGKIATTIQTVVEYVFDSVTNMGDALSFGIVFTMTVTVLCAVVLAAGFSLSLYHAFSSRTPLLLEIRAMILFSGVVTAGMSLWAYQAIIESPFQNIGTHIIVAMVALLYTGAAFMSFELALKGNGMAPWHLHQSTLLLTLFIVAVVFGVGWWGVLHGWEEYAIYQTALSASLLLAAIKYRKS